RAHPAAPDGGNGRALAGRPQRLGGGRQPLRRRVLGRDARRRLAGLARLDRAAGGRSEHQQAPRRPGAADRAHAPVRRPALPRSGAAGGRSAEGRAADPDHQGGLVAAALDGDPARVGRGGLPAGERRDAPGDRRARDPHQADDRDQVRPLAATSALAGVTHGAGFWREALYPAPMGLWSRQEEAAVVFGRFERLIDPYPREVMAAPPRSMGVFLGWFIRRAWPLLVSISLLGATLAVAEVSVFWFMGALVDWLTHSRPQTFFARHGATLAWIAAAYVLVLPAVQFGWQLCFNQALFGNFPMLARWRMHTYLLRQSLAFFQNDMAGRLTQTVMQTALATRESVTKIIDILVYVAVYFVSAVLLVGK